MFSDANAISIKQLPSGLRERERRVPGSLLETRPTSRRNLKEALVRLIQSLNYVLPGLRVEAVPTAFVALFTFGQMALERVVAGVFVVDLVVSASERHKVIPYLRSKLNLAGQMLVALGAIQAIFKCLSQGLGLFVNVLLDDLLADLSRRGTKVRACPQRWQSEQALVFLPQYAAASPLECVDNLVWSVASVGLQKQVNMVWLDSKCDHRPVVFLCDFFDNLAKPTGKGTLKNPLTTLWTPDKVILYCVNGVSTSAVFFVDRYTTSTSSRAYGPRIYGGFLVCELENHQRRGPRIPGLKTGGLKPLRATPLL